MATTNEALAEPFAAVPGWVSADHLRPLLILHDRLLRVRYLNRQRARWWRTSEVEFEREFAALIA